MSLRRISIVLLPVAALLVAGCGGGGDDDSTESTAVTTAAPAALTKAELIEQGDAICAEVNAAVGTVGTSSAETASPAVEAADLYSGMVASLNNLGTPEEAEGYAEFSSAAEELAKAQDEVQLASERSDTAALETAESNASSSLTTFQNAAGEYGLEDCSDGPSAPATAAPGKTGETGEAEVGEEAEAAEPEAVEPEVEEEAAPEVVPETGGAGGAIEGGGTGGGSEGGGGGSTGGSSGGIGPG